MDRYLTFKVVFKTQIQLIIIACVALWIEYFTEIYIFRDITLGLLIFSVAMLIPSGIYLITEKYKKKG